MGGFLLLPSLRIRPKNDLHGIIKNFCRSENETERKYDLRKPFVLDGQAYGTDGRAAARIVTTDNDTSTDKRRIPVIMTSVWDDYWTERGQWFPLPAERLIAGPGPCPRCWQYFRVTCPECHGKGWEDRDAGMMDCRRCHGDGEVGDPNCLICHGRLWGMNYPSRQPIENKLISVEFWRKLQAIPGVMVNVGNPDRAHPILCKSDVGVECLVMPICADYHNQE